MVRAFAAFGEKVAHKAIACRRQQFDLAAVGITQGHPCEAFGRDPFVARRLTTEQVAIQRQRRLNFPHGHGCVIEGLDAQLALEEPICLHTLSARIISVYPARE